MYSLFWLLCLSVWILFAAILSVPFPLLVLLLHCLRILIPQSAPLWAHCTLHSQNGRCNKFVHFIGYSNKSLEAWVNILAGQSQRNQHQLAVHKVAGQLSYILWQSGLADASESFSFPFWGKDLVVLVIKAGSQVLEVSHAGLWGYVMGRVQKEPYHRDRISYTQFHF